MFLFYKLNAILIQIIFSISRAKNIILGQHKHQNTNYLSLYYGACKGKNICCMALMWSGERGLNPQHPASLPMLKYVLKFPPLYNLLHNNYFLKQAYQSKLLFQNCILLLELNKPYFSNTLQNNLHLQQNNIFVCIL